MPKMIIKEMIYTNLLNRGLKNPRERFIRYYNDLHDLENCVEVNPESYKQGEQYSYVDLGDSILKKFRSKISFHKLEMLVVCYWTHEFDPDYSCGSYFCHKYGIKGKTFDVCDQGILSPIMGFKIIHDYISNKMINNALLLAFDQTTIPLSNNYDGIVPAKTSAAGIYIENNFEKEGIKEINQISICNSEIAFYSDKEEINIIDVNSKVKEKNMNCAEIIRSLMINNDVSNSKKKNVLKVSDKKLKKTGYILWRYL